MDAPLQILVYLGIGVLGMILATMLFLALVAGLCVVAYIALSRRAKRDAVLSRRVMS